MHRTVSKLKGYLNILSHSEEKEKTILEEDEKKNNAAKRTAKQIRGQKGEDQALKYLQQQGLRLIKRNFRCRTGEIDLIMQDAETVVFVEVRLRAKSDFGGALASITPAKQKRIISAAQNYLQKLPRQPACRFDAITIDGEKMEWIKNIIDVNI